MHAEHVCYVHVWSKWYSGAVQRREEKLKHSAADSLYKHTLLQKNLNHWRNRVINIQTRYGSCLKKNIQIYLALSISFFCVCFVLLVSQRRFEQAEGHHEQRCLKRAMTDWHQVYNVHSGKTCKWFLNHQFNSLFISGYYVYLKNDKMMHMLCIIGFEWCECKISKYRIV